MRSLVVVAVVLASVPAPAAEPTLELARGQVKELHYAEAAKTLGQLASVENLSRAEVIEFYTLEGLVKGALNDGPGAKKAFTRVLLLDPEFKLPGRLSPRVSTPFLEAKGWVREHGQLGLPPGEQRRLGELWVFDFKAPTGDPEWVDAVLFSCLEDGTPREVTVSAKGPIQLELKARQVNVTWKLLGPHRWVLGEGGPVALSAPPPPLVVAPLPSVAEALASRPPAAIETPKKEPARLSPAVGITLLGVGSTAALTSAIFFSAASFNADQARAASTHEELISSVNSGKTSQTIAGVLLGSGIATASAGVALLIYSLLPAHAPAAVTLVPTSTGGLAVFQGSF